MAIEITVLCLYLAVSVALGLYVGRGNRRLEDYLLGGRSLPWWALLGSIVATETSTATFLGIPPLAFKDGGNFTFLQLAVGYVIGRALVVVLILPAYFSGKLFTAYQLLDQRFGPWSKSLASVMFLVARNLGDGLRLYLAALALNTLLPISMMSSVIAIGILTVVYTFLGGLRSVVWNDCIQFIVYMLGGAAILVFILYKLPHGWSDLSAYATAHDKWLMWNLRFDLKETFTIWSGIIGGAFLTLGTHGTDQLIVQRLLSSRNQVDASKALMTSGLVVLLQFAFFLLLGVAIACYYATLTPDNVAERSDQVVPMFVVHELPLGYGLAGLILAAVFAAAMSTLSSSLSSSASSAIHDLVQPWLGWDDEDPRLLTAGRCATVFFGVIQVLVGLLGILLSKEVIGEVLAIAGFTAGVMLGVFLLGIFTRKIGQAASLCAMLGGMLTVASVHVYQAAAWPWYAVVGSVSTVATGIAVQLIIHAVGSFRPRKHRPSTQDDH